MARVQMLRLFTTLGTLGVQQRETPIASIN